MTDLTVVIGGGAAGITAARTLHDAGRPVLLLEAKDRLGGRAHSVSLADLVVGGPDWLPAFAADARVDYGCGWLHSARRNPWTTIARDAGAAVDTTPPGWGEQWRDLGYTADEQAAFDEAYDAWDAAAHALLPQPDRALAEVPANPRWRPMLDSISGWANGAPLSAVSLHDWAAYDDAAGADNWTLPAGYGTLVVGHAGGVPHRLGTPVTAIDHRGRDLRIETGDGTIAAARAIVCVPTSALAGIRFDPPLPAKLDAAAALPLGLADKVFLAVDRPEWPRQAHLIGNPHAACTASHRLSPFGLPIVESFFGGDCAEAWEDGDAAQFAIDELVALLGSDWRARLHPLARTRWRHEPYIGGSYSHARIGAAPQRHVLAEPVDERLFFAGEACHPFDFSTAHGAYRTGLDAARAIVDAVP